MKVVFLDVDGVLLAGRHLRRGLTGRARLPADTMTHLNAICAASHAVVVVSSTWRMLGAPFKPLLVDSGFAGAIHPDWCTKVITDPPLRQLMLGGRRGIEIQEWLDRHPEVIRYLILDDDSDMLVSQRPHFLQTAFADGLKEWHIGAAECILRIPRRSDASLTTATA